MIRVVHPGLSRYPSRIPDLGVKKAPDPGSGSATLGSGQRISLSQFELRSQIVDLHMVWYRYRI
jgi:hypothetical protein